jgi:hypothetical protein
MQRLRLIKKGKLNFKLDDVRSPLQRGAADRAGVGLSQNGQFMYLVDVDNVSLASEANLFTVGGPTPVPGLSSWVSA